MTTHDDDLDARHMPEGHLMAWRSLLRLDQFLRDHPGSRERYMGLVEELHDLLMHFHGRTPAADQVRTCLAEVLGRDDLFRAYAIDQAPAESCDERNWRQILLAGAGTLMIEYDKSLQPGDTL